MFRRFSFALAGLCAGALVAGDDWTQFRGPSADNIAKGPPAPGEWSADKNIKWKASLPGTGWSAPVVVGDHVFITSAYSEKETKPKPMGGGGMGGGRGGFGQPGGFPGGPPGGGPPGGGPPNQQKGDAKDTPKGEQKGGQKGGRPGGFGGGRGGFGGGMMGKGGPPPNMVYQWQVFCLDKNTGEVVWKRQAAEKKPTIAKHGTNTYASETPVTDGERLYVYFGMTGLYCYSLKGEPIWNKDLGSYPMVAGWGTGSSPVLLGDRLYVQCDNEEKSFLVCLDKKTGEELWRKPREERSNWSTPYVWKNKVRTELVALGSKRVRSYNPETGDVLWEMTGLDSGSMSSPASDGDAIFFGISGPGSNSPFFAVKAGASGDISLKEDETSNAYVLWKKTGSGSRGPSPLLLDGRVYVLRNGTLTCLDAKTGKQIYDERLPNARGFTTSPWASDGRIYCLDEDGTCFVVKAGPKFEIVGKNKLGEMFWSSPALSDGAIYLRGVDTLYCIKQS